MAKQAVKSEQKEYTLEDLLSEARSELEELGEAVRESYDNMPEGLQGSAIGEARDEAANTLEGLDSPEVPAAYAGNKIIYHWFPSRKKNPSKRDLLDAILDKVETVLTTLQEKHDELDEADDDKKDQDKIDELANAIEEIERLKDDCDGIEFR